MSLTSISPFAKQTFTERLLYTRDGARPVKGSKKKKDKNISDLKGLQICFLESQFLTHLNLVELC